MLGGDLEPVLGEEIFGGVTAVQETRRLHS